MSKKKHPQASTSIPASPPKLPVLHGTCFTTFIDEAHSLGNEVMARREFCADVVEYLKQKGLMDEWGAWREAKRNPKPVAAND